MCYGWELVGDPHRFDAAHVMAHADVLHASGDASLVDARAPVVVADMWNVERLIASGPRVIDHRLPEYGFQRDT